MKKLAAGFLALQLLLASIASGGLFELIRVPALCDHYAQHQRESAGNMTWDEFLVMHFFDPEHEHTDGGRHHRLPFHGAAHGPSVFLPLTDETVPADGEPLEEGNTRPSQGSIGEWPGRSVFHPPKYRG
jgi:hypothetical protein